MTYGDFCMFNKSLLFYFLYTYKNIHSIGSRGLTGRRGFKSEAKNTVKPLFKAGRFMGWLLLGGKINMISKAIATEISAFLVSRSWSL